MRQARLANEGLFPDLTTFYSSIIGSVSKQSIVIVTMEPVSIAASVITLAGVAGRLSKLIRKNIELSSTPDVLLALNQEILDLQLVIDDIEDVLRYLSIPPPRTLENALQRVKSTVLQLDKFVAYELTAYVGGLHFRCGRLQFLRPTQDIPEACITVPLQAES